MNKNNLTLQIIEYAPSWEQSLVNLNSLSQLLQDTPSSDLIILPEMFNTGFSMNAKKISEPMNGKSITWMKETSIKLQSAVCGSLAIEENNQYYNRFIFVSEGEILAQYDKRHLFSYSGEPDHYTAGNIKVTFNYKGWKICPMVCFDLRFPVWNRNTDYYDLMLNVACWPSTRMLAWDTLLKARAIENMSYVCGVNRTGTDGMKLIYNGHSAVFSPLGMQHELITIKEHCYQTTISLDDVKKYREKYKFLEERDSFSLL